MRHTSLIYHDVIDAVVKTSGFGGGDAEVYKLDAPTFQEHLLTLRQVAGLVPALVQDQSDLAQSYRLRTLTFDDGGASALAVIAPMLEAMGWRGHFFVPTSMIGAPGFIEEAGVRELAERGHVVGSHSHTHPIPISELPDDALWGEWRTSRERLESILRQPCVVASVPGGYLTHRVAEAADRAGFRVLFTSEPRTDVWRVGECALLGRFSVRRHSAPAEVVALLSGEGASVLRQKVAWTVKRALKGALGSTWLNIRRRLLADTPELR